MPRNKTKAKAELIEALRKLGTLQVSQRGRTLYERGEENGGVFLVEQGWVKVSCMPESSSDLHSEVVGPNSILAMSETMSGRPYKATAEAISETRVRFIPAAQLQQLAKTDSALCWAIVEFLSHDLHDLYSRVQSIGFAGMRAAGVPHSRPC